MSDGTVAMIVIGSVASYALVAGATWQLLGSDWSSERAVFGGLFWPLTLPAMLGARLTKRLVDRWTSRDFPSARVR